MVWRVYWQGKSMDFKLYADAHTFMCWLRQGSTSYACRLVSK